MGLVINNYSYNYGTLQSLRRWALLVEKNKRKLMCFDYGVNKLNSERCKKCVYCNLNGVLENKKRKEIVEFYEFVDHSDSDGGYISFSLFGIKESPEKIHGEWGDLDRLKAEVKELDKHTKSLNGKLLNAWNDFKTDVYRSRDILIFS